MQGPSMGPVSVMPNASVVTGTVQGIEHPATARWPVLELTIRCADDVEGLPNFVAGEVGKTIPIHLRGQVRADQLAPQAQVRLRVEFRGDERGGGYYAHADDLEYVSDSDDS